MKKVLSIEEILKQFMMDESKRKGKKWIRRKLSPTDLNFYKAMMCNTFGVFGAYFIKNDLTYSKKRVSWKQFREYELCRKGGSKQFDAVDVMTRGERTVGATYDYLQQFQKITDIKHKQLRKYIKERLKRSRIKTPHWMIALIDKHGKAWLADGNHRTFTTLWKKSRGKQHTLPIIYEFKKKTYKQKLKELIKK